MKNYNLLMRASSNPVEQINKVAYAGQPAHMRLYHPGYETFMNQMPVLTEGDPFLKEKVSFTKEVMASLGRALQVDPWAFERNLPMHNDFNRTILAIQAADGLQRLGNEIIMARWGKGFATPPHGHLKGLHYEEVIRGKVRIDTYQLTEHSASIVRPCKSSVVEIGTFSDEYLTEADPSVSRSANIHSITALEPSITIHYTGEHPGDGHHNSFGVEYWDKTYEPTREDFEQITTLDSMFLQNGDVALVRSQNVPDFGDHYIVVTGRPVVKTHGLRIQVETISAPTASHILDSYEMRTGVTALKLNKRSTADFLAFHNIVVVDGIVKFENAISLTA